LSQLTHTKTYESSQAFRQKGTCSFYTILGIIPNIPR
jgi:hypothetical protein